MTRLLLIRATTLCCALSFMGKAQASTNAASDVARKPIKEPTYQSVPKYSHLAIGNYSVVKVLMVEDGNRLFVDKNANGDLTDDGPPIQQSKIRALSAELNDRAEASRSQGFWAESSSS